MKTYKLNENAYIPTIGLGTWQLTGEDTEYAVRNALDVGYRLIDTADKYGNHKYIGKAIKQSGIDRKDIFITSKVWRNNLYKEEVIDAGKRFLDELQTNYLDLLLIYWPNSSIPIENTMEGFAQLKEDGYIKAIGVSNFTITHLEEAMSTGVEISNNQVEFHPSLYQKEILDFCKENNIVLTAYSPLGRGEDMEIDIIIDLAENYNKTPAQVILNWILQKGVVAIPKAASKDHIKENFDSLNWSLSQEDTELIDSIDSSVRHVDHQFGKFSRYSF